MKTALITGITGQDGSYLSELLLEKGYEVHGIIRRSSSPNTNRIDHIFDQLHLHYGDMSDGITLAYLVAEIQPDEIYNLAAQSHVRLSFDIPAYSADIAFIGTLRLLEAIRTHHPSVRFYQASSSEMFGSSPPPQNESTPFCPQSPYAIAKTAAFHAVKQYRSSYKLFASNGILFNHESPRRGITFVTKKITRSLARILKGEQKVIKLGNLDAKRDWGFAPEYVEAMWRILQNSVPDDFVIATGNSHSVREFLTTAFELVNLKWQDYVQIDPKYYRPAEVDALQGDPSKAEQILGWKPQTQFRDLVKIMLNHDLKEFGIEEIK